MNQNQNQNNKFKINGTVRARIYECYSQGIGLSTTSVLINVPVSYIEKLFIEFDKKKKAISVQVNNSWITLKQPTSNFVLLTNNPEVLQAYDDMINYRNKDE